MTADVIVGIDAGTSVIKAVAFDLEGRQLALTARPNRYEELPGGGVEQDQARTWRDTVVVLRDLVAAVPDLAQRVAAIGVTGQGDGTWLVDRAGAPVGKGWLWLDSRAAGIVGELERSGARAAIYQHTGCGMNACNQSAQMIWLDRHAPDLLDRAATAFHCKDWLYLNLTGERATDITEGVFTFGDFRTRRYAPAVLDALGLRHREQLLPPILDGTQVTHPLTPDAAALIGLPVGTPVALGVVDVVCTALGAGLYDPGRRIGCSIVGSTGMHMRLVPDAGTVELAPEPSGYIMSFPVHGAVARMQSNMAATLNVDWIADMAREATLALGAPAVERRAALLALDAQVLERRPGAALFHPYIHEAGERGPFIDTAARAQFTGLSTNVRFLDLVRAVYEGLALAARDCYAATGEAPEEIHMAGGAARSRAFKTILASAVGAPLRETAREEAGAAGVAMMAAVAIGAYPDMRATCRAWVDPLLGERVLPDPALTSVYDRLYPIYARTHEVMRPIWADLRAARRGENP
jgi:erythritol kinase